MKLLIRFWLPMTALVCIGAGAAVLYATPWGAWCYSDTAAYVVSARSFLASASFNLPDAGGGSSLATLTPPFYPFMLSLGALFGLDPLDFARWLNALLCAAFLWVSAWGVRRATDSPAAGLLFALLLACNPLLFLNAASAMSEQLFFFLAFGGLLVLAAPHRLSLRELVLGASSLALAACTRYAGLAFLLAGIWIVFVRLPGRLSARLIHAALFSSGAVLPPLFWLAWTYETTHNFGARSLNVAPGLALARGETFLKASLQILTAWVPYVTRFNALASPELKLAFLGLAWLALLLYLSRKDPRAAQGKGERRLLLAALFAALCYLLFLGLSYASASIPPDLIPRTYSPLYPAIALALFATFSWLARTLPGGRLSLGVWAVLAFLTLVTCAYQLPQILESAARGHTLGVGYTEKFWRQAPVFSYLRAAAPRRLLVSNEPGLVLLYTGRAAYDWKELVPAGLQAARSTPPGSGPSRLDGFLRSGQAVLVLFPERAEELYGPPAREWLREWTSGLSPLYEGEDAGVFQAGPPR